MTYRGQVSGPARRYLSRLPRPVQARIVARISQLQDDPHGIHGKPLQGGSGLWSSRVGGWRIIFEILDSEQRLGILDIGP